jgi:3-methylfumaryl-CoA hydratase
MRSTGFPEPSATAETRQRTEMIVPEPARALARLLDIDAPPLGAGDPLPPLWHWVYLLERHRQSELGRDGHPIQGIPAPPGPGRLRMFAGGRVTTHTPVRFGEPATLTSRVTATVEKEGRGGRLTFVTVRGDIEQGGAPTIVDEQDIVYRTAGHRLSPQTAENVQPPEAGPDRDRRLEFVVDPVVLFRFSALTYNAHRIHYDSAYAAEEGYPDLVVHGPLQALLMGELIRRGGASMRGQEFAYRLVAPTFGAQRLTITTDTHRLGVTAQVRDQGGRITATSTLRPA